MESSALSAQPRSSRSDTVSAKRSDRRLSGRKNAAVLALVMALIAGLTLAVMTLQESRARQLQRVAATKAIWDESVGLLSDGTWSSFNQFYFKFESRDRLRVLDARRHGSPISEELEAFAGADNSKERMAFSAKWWRVRNAFENQALAIETGIVDREKILAGNDGIFGEGDTALPDHPTAIYDRLISDLKAIGLCSPAMDTFRRAVREHSLRRSR